MDTTTLNPFRAFWAGVVAGACMTIIVSLSRGLGLTEINLAMMLGAFFTGVTTAGTWLLGFAIHLVISGLIAVIYYRAFVAWGGASWIRGVWLSIPHALIGGIFMWILPAIHAAIPENPAFLEPGFLAINYGLFTTIAFIALHMLYGAIVGGMIAPAPERVVAPPHAARP